MLNDEIIAKTPIVILANKIDKSTAISKEDLLRELGIQLNDNPQEGRVLSMFMTSLVHRSGFQNALQKLNGWIV